MWRWDQQEPFGVDVPDENPSSLGTFEFPLRFPGQYADKETNLFYNYSRDYDSSLGRYIQADPIGIFGDINVYAYVYGGPTMFSDPYGLRGNLQLTWPIPYTPGATNASPRGANQVPSAWRNDWYGTYRAGR